MIPIRISKRIVLTSLTTFATSAFLILWDMAENDFLFRAFAIACLIIASTTLVLGLLLSTFGSERLRVSQGLLFHSIELFGFERKTHYRVDDIRALGQRIVRYSNLDQEIKDLAEPFRDFGKRGNIKFDLADRSVYLGIAADDETCADVIVWLQRRLPSTAVD